MTWMVFTHILRSGQLLGALRQAGLIADTALMATPTPLLWGAPVDAGARGKEIQGRLRELCAGLREDPNSFSEPDVIVDFGEHGVMFIEVKHQSGNDLKPVDYAGWPRYASAAPLAWRIEDVKGSGCYELARNWCLVRLLSDGRPATPGQPGSVPTVRRCRRRTPGSFRDGAEHRRQVTFRKGRVVRSPDAGARRRARLVFAVLSGARPHRLSRCEPVPL